MVLKGYMMIQENGRTEPSAIQIGIVLFCKCSRLIAPVLWIPAIGIFIDFLTQVWFLIKKNNEVYYIA